MQKAVYARSAERGDDGETIAEQQMIVDSRDEFVGYCERHLSLPTSMSIDEVWRAG